MVYPCEYFVVGVFLFRLAFSYLLMYRFFIFMYSPRNSINIYKRECLYTYS